MKGAIMGRTAVRVVVTVIGRTYWGVFSVYFLKTPIFLWA